MFYKDQVSDLASPVLLESCGLALSHGQSAWHRLDAQ